jgi:hypothetical protein
MGSDGTDSQWENCLLLKLVVVSGVIADHCAIGVNRDISEYEIDGTCAGCFQNRRLGFKETLSVMPPTCVMRTCQRIHEPELAGNFRCARW